MQVREILERLGRAVREGEIYEGLLRSDIHALYPPDVRKERWGAAVRIPIAVDDIMRELEVRRPLHEGGLELRNTKEICSLWGCIDLGRFLTHVKRYYRARGAQAREEYKLRRELIGVR